MLQRKTHDEQQSYINVTKQNPWLTAVTLYSFKNMIQHYTVTFDKYDYDFVYSYQTV